ncbi:hypothetical protein ACFWR9_11345 [Streptomyces sp. NPDC058534]|uniref:hypothetical protein n=1 Tax=Streptomyces sp. NPDC058534 TaxID=3346541 RepID=UPI003652BBD7
MTALVATPTTVDQAHDDLTHVVCYCDPNLALCGTDVTDSDWVDEDEDTTCVVCVDLVDQPCPRCGR